MCVGIALEEALASVTSTDTSQFISQTCDACDFASSSRRRLADDESQALRASITRVRVLQVTHGLVLCRPRTVCCLALLAVARLV